MCFWCVSHFGQQLLHLPHLNKVEQVGEGARVEQGDVAGGKAHLRVGRAVYDGCEEIRKSTKHLMVKLLMRMR